MQGTNDSSAVSKVSAAAQGYFKDDFLKYFVCKVSRRAPLINRSVCTTVLYLNKIVYVLYVYECI